MSLVAINKPIWIPDTLGILRGAPAAAAGMIVDATGEGCGFVGSFWHKDGIGASKNITSIIALTGTITSADGSSITASLQDVSLTAGAPGRPDGTLDQSVTVNINTLSSNTVTTFTLGAARTIAVGAPLSAAFEFDVGGRLGADVLQIVPGLVGGGSTNINYDFGGHAVLRAAAGTWSTVAATPVNILFGCDDGTFGALLGALPFSAVGSLTYANNSNPDEYCLDFSFPFPCTLGCGGAYISQGSSARDYSIVLYEGTTQRAIATVDGNTSLTNAQAERGHAFAAAYSIAKDTVYSISARPDSTGAIVLYYIDLNHADHRQALGPGWNTGAIRSRVDAGAWSARTTTRIPLMWLGVTALDNGAGGGGGMRLAGHGGLAA